MLDQLKEKFEKMYQQDIELPEYFGRRYDVVSCIKHTEQKQVYLLREKTGAKRAVMKCGFGMYREILKEEYKLLCRLAGDGFPEVYAWEELPDRSFFVREYVEGDTLQELMEREETLSVAEALEAAEQVCGLLNRLHSQTPPIIYRDVKPQNVVRTLQGNYVLIDLDTARMYKDGAGEDTMFMGTRGYASPEQFGFQQTDVRTDVYGFGMLLLYLMTGGYEKGKTFANLPQKIKRIIAKCTEFNPKDRYKSIREVEHALQKLPGTKGYQKLFWKRKKLWHKLSFAVILLVLTTATVLGVFATQYRKNIVEFSNPKIERAIRERVKKTDGSAITKEDLENIYTLIICGEKVFSSWVEYEEYLAHNWYVTDTWVQPAEPFELSDLSMFSNLNTLIIEFQNVTELPDLSHLPLVQVSFCNNTLTDISGLAGCTGIRKLLLHNNPIRDITALRNMAGLEQLDLARTKVSDLSPVKSEKIKALYLEFNNISDYSVFERFPAIEDLRVAGASKEEIEQLIKIDGLVNLSLYESEVDSLLLFQQMKNLVGLELAGCTVLTSMEGLEKLPNLTFLGLAGTGIESLPEHFYHDKLELLEVTGTGIKDFKALLRCPNLRYLYVSEEIEEAASMQLSGGNITVTGIK